MPADHHFPEHPEFQVLRWWRYLGVAVLTFLVVTGSVLALNLLVDPLWFDGGNRLTKRNFVFNERHAKVNLYRQDPRRYDCLVFGSSRATLLNASLIRGHDCFNFAFSGGLVGEFVVLAEYLKHLGARPDLVIVGVDGFSFRRQANLENLPEFVRRQQLPPGRLRTYVSFDALDFSIKTLRDESPMPRYYRQDFTAAIRADAPVYRPADTSADSEVNGNAGQQPAGPPAYDGARLSDYARLRQVFPEAKFIGYIPPVSAWEMERIATDNLLDQYLALMHTLARSYEPFMDYSIPSPITWDIMATYDGSHYNLAVNRLIAEGLSGADNGFGIRVDGMSLEDYRQAYKLAMDRFRDFKRGAAGD